MFKSAPLTGDKDQENRNSKAKADVDYFAPCNWYFRLFIFNRSEASDELTTKAYLVAIARFLACTSFTIFGSSLHLIRFYSDSPVCVLEDLVVTMYYIISSVAFVVLTLRSYGSLTAGIRYLYQGFPKPKDLDQMMRMQQKCTRLILASLYTVLLATMIFRNLDVTDCGEFMHTAMGYRNCGFTLPIWLPIEFNGQLIRLCLVVLQFVHVEILVTLFVIFAATYAIIIHHLVRGFDILILLVEDVDNESKNTSRRDRLVTFIKLHSKFLESMNVNIEATKPYLLIFVLSAIVFVGCPIIDIIWVGPTLIVLGMLLGWLFGMIFVMVISQKLTDKSVELNRAIYNLRWYDLDKESKYLFLFILMRTQQPMAMKTPFSDISHATLLNAMKAIYSFTTAMVQCNHE